MKTTRPNHTKLLSFLVISVVILAACRKAECLEPITVANSAILLKLKDASGNYLYTETFPIFEIDSLKVFDEFGNQMPKSIGLALIPNTPLTFWQFDLGPVYNPQTDQESLNSEYCKKFIIKYYHNMADTITTCFKVHETKCGSLFSPLKIYQHGVLLTEVTNTILAEATVIKN